MSYNYNIFQFLPCNDLGSAMPCRRLVLVSTMDGHLTAINAATGVEEWSVSTGITLASSSISKFEVRMFSYSAVTCNIS